MQMVVVFIDVSAEDSRQRNVLNNMFRTLTHWIDNETLKEMSEDWEPVLEYFLPYIKTENTDGYILNTFDFNEDEIRNDFLANLVATLRLSDEKEMLEHSSFQWSPNLYRILDNFEIVDGEVERDAKRGVWSCYIYLHGEITENENNNDVIP